MADQGSLDWSWLSGDAIEDFKRSRIQEGATSASASSYATGARAFVRHCRKSGVGPADGIDSFETYLAGDHQLSVGTRSDYRSHARAFVRFLQSHDRVRSDLSGLTTRTMPPSAVHSTAGPDEGPPADELTFGEWPDAAARWIESLDGAPTVDLLAGYAQTLRILRERGVLRTANAPLGDYAEWLVWRAFGGTLEPNSTKSHDVTDRDGRRLQVKARLVSPKPTPGQLQTSVFRSWAFDYAVLIQLDERDYSVVRASVLPVALFDEGRANARWSEHVKGWAVFMTPELMGHADAIDVTMELRNASLTQ